MGSWLRARLDGLEAVSLGVRLTVLVAVPLAAIAMVSLVLISGRWAAAAESGAVSERVERVELVQAAIRAVQAEREGTVQVVLADQTGVNLDEARAVLDLARVKTDLAILDAGLGRELDQNPDLFLRRPSEAEVGVSEAALGGRSSGRASPREVGEGPPSGGRGAERSVASGEQPAGTGGSAAIATDLSSLRELSDQGILRTQSLFSAYSNLVGQYQEDIFESARVSSGRHLSASLVSYEQWQQAIEWFAQVRVAGFHRLVNPDEVAWQRIAQLSDSEELFVQLARQSAEAAESAELDLLLEAPGVQEGAAARRLMLEAGDGPALISVSDWMAQTAARLAALNAGADFLLYSSIDQAEAAEASAQRDLALIAVATAVVMLLVAFGAWSVARSISRPLHRLALTTQLASSGQLIEVDVPRSHDAIGEIGAAMGELKQRSDDLADAAAQIASGDLTVEMRPRSGGDRLGWALRTMTQRLAAMVAESEQRSEQLAHEVGTLQETASRDVLTGLANRRRFSHLFEAGLVTARAEGAELGLLFVDLDGFKSVNDTMGHDVGDELLRRVSDRLSAVIGPEDTVGRFGGDEFTVIVRPTEEHDRDYVRMTARRVLEALTVAYNIEGRNVRLGASVGVALFPEHGSSAAALLRASDQAMYEAKEAGGGVHVAPTPEAAA